MKVIDVDRRFSVAYKPQTNGIVESHVKIFANLLRKSIEKDNLKN
jgi:hypothetical protein